MWEFRSRLSAQPFSQRPHGDRLGLARKLSPKETWCKLTTDQGRIYRANRGPSFLSCKTVSFFRFRVGERLAPLAIEDRPPTAGMVGMRAMTPPPQPIKKIAVDATIHSCGRR